MAPINQVLGSIEVWEKENDLFRDRLCARKKNLKEQEKEIRKGTSGSVRREKRVR